MVDAGRRLRQGRWGAAVMHGDAALTHPMALDIYM